MDKVNLFINRKIYDGWKTAEVRRSLKAASGSFSLSVTDRWTDQKEPWIIAPGDSAELKIGSDLVVTGYVDSVSSDAQKDSVSIAVAGRDSTCDLIDCSIVSEKGEYINVTLKKLAETFCKPFGIPVKAPSSTGLAFDVFKIQQGESVFEALERASRMRGYLLTTDGAGSLEITRPGNVRSSTRLEQGINIIAISSVFDFKNRFSQYIIKGQDNGFNNTVDPAFAYSLKAIANDPTVKRYRPLVVQSEQITNLNTAQIRAKWEATTRSAKASKFNATLAGWRQGDGSLWRPNQLVYVKAPRVGLDGELLITDATFSLSSDGGTTTVLSLERKDAYNPEPLIEKTDPLVQAIKKDPGIKRGPQ